MKCFYNTIQVQKSVYSVDIVAPKTGKFIAITPVFSKRFPWRKKKFLLSTSVGFSDANRVETLRCCRGPDGWNDWLATEPRSPCLRKHGRDKPIDDKTLVFFYAEYAMVMCVMISERFEYRVQPLTRRRWLFDYPAGTSVFVNSK